MGVRGLTLGVGNLNWSSSEFCHESIAVLQSKVAPPDPDLWPVSGRRADFEVLKSTLENEKRDFERALGVIPDGLCFSIIKLTPPLKNMGV